MLAAVFFLTKNKTANEKYKLSNETTRSEQNILKWLLIFDANRIFFEYIVQDELELMVSLERMVEMEHQVAMSSQISL